MKSRLTRTVWALGLSVTTLTATVSAGTAYANTGENYKQKINDIEKKQQQNKNELNKTKSDLANNKSQQQDINAQLAAIKKEIDTAVANISAKQKEITATQNQIDQLKKSIDQIQKRIAERDALLKERVRAMYVSGGSIDYLQVILGSKDFGDFVTRVLALNTIAEQDRKILNEQKADKAKLVDQEAQVSQKLSNLNKDLADLKSMQSELASKKAKQQSLLAQLKEKEGELENLVMSQEEVAKNLAAQKSAAQKAYELWKAEQSKPKPPIQQDGYSSPRSGNTNAVMQWPTSGHVNSGYGYRSYDNSFHPGIDIAAPEGTPVRAAASGVVFRAYQSSSYGNCVMITHYIGGQEYTTVYAHMSGYTVGSGSVVQAGQVIGYVGSTGESSGNHLHFEVYRGQWTPPPHPGTINPLNVLP
ncbi:MAG: murein hydrolase activator EnvC family protein [Tuberibacillus sp.]